MDWGNAIVRFKKTDTSGQVLSVEMDLHLEGDFRKTKKKITWLAAPIANYPLVDARLLDYDYIITKKKLEDDDNVADFVTPVTEFKEEAFADANVRDIEKGNILQFERKGYFVYDGSVDGVMEFIRIPDGRAANLASKAGINTPVDTSAKPKTEEPAAEDVTTMYKMDHIYGEDLEFDVSTKMYHVQSVYT
jgi:glutamyl-tRNA synthetase